MDENNIDLPTDLASFTVEESAPADELSTLLREFEAATAQPEPATPQPSDQPLHRDERPTTLDPGSSVNLGNDIDKIAEELRGNPAAEQAWEQAELRGKVESLTGALQSFIAERQLERDKSDFQKIVDHANTQYLADMAHLPDGYAKRWLESEAINNPQLREAFDRRHDDPQSRFRAERVVKKTLERMQREAKSAPDPQATEDVAAVTAAVRGTMNKAPPSRPVQYGNMSNREFRQHVKETHGYDPGI